MIKPLFNSMGEKITVGTVCLLGILVTVAGLYTLSWPQAVIWSDLRTFVNFILLNLLSFIIISLASWRLKLNAFLCALLSMTLVAIIAGAVWSLLVIIWITSASAILGHWFLKKIRIETDNWVNWVLTGIGIYGTLAGLLAHYPINYPGLYGISLALPLILGWRIIYEIDIFNAICVWKKTKSKFKLNLLDLAISTISLFYFIVALMPELGYDALAMHLYIPSHLAQRHQWGFDASTYVWAVMPMLGDWIFSIGYLLAGETASRFINISFIFLLAVLIRDIVQWAGGTTYGARWAILLFLSTPLTFTEGSSLYIESIWACFVVAGSFALLRSCTFSDKSKFEISISGLMLGYALAAKALTFTIALALLLILIKKYKTWSKILLFRYLLFSFSLFSVFGFIPYITAWVLTGNPVFPLFNKIFKSPYYSSVTNFENPAYTSGFNWDSIYRVTFQSSKYIEGYAGAAGFQWLLLLIPSVVIFIISKNRKGLALIFLGLVPILITFQSQSYLRYIFPSSVILTASVGVVLNLDFLSRSIFNKIFVAIASSAIMLNILFINAGNAFYQDFPIKTLIDDSSRENYLENRMPIRNAVKLVNSLNKKNSPVAVFSDPLMAGIFADELYPGWYNSSFQKEIALVQTEVDFVNTLLNRGVQYIILDANWNGVNCCGDGIKKQKIIEKTTEVISEYGFISIRRIKFEYQFKTELLINSNLQSSEGWSFASGVKYNKDSGIITATVSAPAIQKISVAPHGSYLNTVVSRCANAATLGRLQVNWLDLNEKIVRVDIKTFECSPTWSEHQMQISTPVNAKFAAIYISGQSEIPLEYKMNSFLQ